MTGMDGEKDEDTQKSIELIKRILPGDGMVSPVAYYPGTALYNKMKKAGRINDDIWFTSAESGIFLRNDKAAKKSMLNLLNGLAQESGRGQYTLSDFKSHRETGGECWVTDIMEGDIFIKEQDARRAEKVYGAMLKKFPDNIWAYLRMGKAKSIQGDLEGALEFYGAARELIPQFFGSWMKTAEVLAALGRRREAERFAAEAMRLNPYDERILTMRVIKSLDT
jgi:tetratricopeptide (TPR) repeat protein